MKLYATVTSERATKGQGGNEYIDIHITNAQKNTLWCVNIAPSGFLRLSTLSDTPNRSTVVYEGYAKGEKQKGENVCTYCGYTNCPRFRGANHCTPF